MATVRATRAASLDQLLAESRARLDRMLAHGTTTVEVKTGYGLSVESELKLLEAIAVLNTDHPITLVPTFLGAHTVPAEHRGTRETYVRQLVEEMLPEVSSRGLARYADAFVDPHAFSVDEARMVLGAAREHGLGVRVHADQLSDEGAAKLAADLAAASADHLEYASDAGLEAMARLLESREPSTPPVADYISDWEKKWQGEFYIMQSSAVGWPPHEKFNGDGVRDRTHALEKPEGGEGE